MSLRTRLALIMLAAAIPLVGGWLWARQKATEANLDETLQEFATVHMEAGGRRRCEADPSTFAVALGPRLAGDAPGPPPRRPPDERLRPGERPPRPGEFGMDDDGPRGPGPRGRRKGPGKRGAGPGRRGRRGPPPRVERKQDPRHRTDMWAYDASFVSANPKAPPMPRVLQQALGTEETRAGLPWQTSQVEGRQVAVRMPWADGPCAFVLVRRPFPPDAEASTRIHVWGAILLAVGLLLAMLLAIGPVLRRIRRLTNDVERAAMTQYVEEVDAAGNDEIGELGAAFNAASTRVRTQMDELEEREKTLRAFVANTTHDVMIPLTVLQGHLSALRKQAEDNDSAETSHLKSSFEEAHYIGCLVQNLSTMAKLEAGEVHLNKHDLDLVELVRRAVARHEPLARERSVIIDTVLPPEPVVVRGDVTLLEQAVSNVVSNAVRYNRDGGRVVIVLEARTGTDHFCLRVFDDGPGVSEAEMERLTERSFRGEAARTRRPGGGGLGLHITRDVIERHGWALTVGPAVSGGLEIVFEGPLAPRSPG